MKLKRLKEIVWFQIGLVCMAAIMLFLPNADDYNFVGVFAMSLAVLCVVRLVTVGIICLKNWAENCLCFSCTCANLIWLLVAIALWLFECYVPMLVLSILSLAMTLFMLWCEKRMSE